MPAGYDGTDYEYQPSFILGFPRYDKQMGEGIIPKSGLKPTENEVDWHRCRSLAASATFPRQRQTRQRAGCPA